MRKSAKYPVVLILLLLTLAIISDPISNAASPNREKVWHISTGLKYAYHQYYDVPAWNANGSRLLLRGRKGTVYLVKDMDDAPELVKLPEPPMGAVQWDRTRPEIFYYVTRDRSHQTAVFSYNIASQEAKLLFKAPGGLQLAPPHPDGEHVLLYPQSGGVGIAEIYSLQTQKVLIIPLPGTVYWVRFTKHADLSVFCNLENAETVERTSWIMDAYTGVAKQLVSGMMEHPDWQPGGFLFSYCENDRLCLVNRKGESVKVIPDFSGVQSWSEDGKSLVIDVTNKKSKYYGEIVICDPNSGEIRTLVEHHFQPGNSATPQPNPHFSPDKTKVVYNSNNIGKNSSQVYVVKVKSPEPVKNLRVASVKSGWEVTWSTAGAKELKSYQIAKIYADGRRVRLGELDERQTKYLLKQEENLKSFEIIAQEYSGLESEPATVDLVTKSTSWLDNLF